MLGEHIRLYHQSATTADNAGRSRVDFSSFREFECHFQPPLLSVKYVVSGVERYTLDRTPYNVEPGRYLLAPVGCQARVLIDSPEPVKGVCIDLSPHLLAEVVAVNRLPQAPELSGELYRFITSSQFPGLPEIPDQGTSLGRYLLNVDFQGLHEPLLLQEFLYGVVERLLADQEPAFHVFQNLDSVRASTRKDLLWRLMKGKDFIDSCFLSKISVAEMARAATLSEYYFLKLFKKAFGQTPYQYMLQKRLLYAAELLQTTGAGIEAVAYEAGFTSIYVFSHAFKARFGYSPLVARKQARRR
jgi:AraC-like DNA-binding protein